MIATLETVRLRLRPFSPADAHSLFAILGDRETMAFSFPMTRAESDCFLREQLLLRQPPVGYALEERSSAELVGYILFCPLHTPGDWELGWFLRRDRWRRGYALEISLALLDYGFSALGAHRIVAETIDPLRAGGLLTRLGMARTGEKIVRDHRGREAVLVEYGLTAAQYQAAKQKGVRND